jgi:hypothetical protein
MTLTDQDWQTIRNALAREAMGGGGGFAQLCAGTLDKLLAPHEQNTLRWLLEKRELVMLDGPDYRTRGRQP